MSKIDFELTTTEEAPAGGWRYVHHISGCKFHHFDYVTIFRQVVEHNKGNDYEMPDDFVEVFHDEMCKQNSWGIKTCRRINGGRIARSALLFSQAFSYGKVLWEFLKSGGKFVSQEEAEERAAICRNCPLNVPESWGCGSCSQRIHDLAQEVLGERKTALDSELGYCGICSCLLKASVHYPLQAQEKGLTDEMKEKFKEVPHCWKKSIVEQ